MISQIRLTFFAMLLGIIYGAIYGTILILRRIVILKNKRVKIFLELLEDIICALYIYFTLYDWVVMYNKGLLRTYIFIGIISGVAINFAVIYYPFNNVVVKLIIKVIVLTKKIFMSCYKFISQKIIPKIKNIVLKVVKAKNKGLQKKK